VLVGIDASRAVRPIVTGTEEYSRQLIAALARRPSGNRYRLYIDREPATPIAMGTSVETRLIRFPRLWTQLRLSGELRRYPPDLLFIPSHVIPLVCAVPAVVTIHDVGYLWNRSAYRPLAWVLLHLGTILNARKARLIVADSEATAADLAHHFSVPREKVRVAYLGGPVVDPDRLPEPAPRQLSRPSRFFLFVGTLHRRKNLSRLLRAFARVRQSSNDQIGLVIAGADGAGAASLRVLADRLGIAGAVSWVGYVSEAERRALFAEAMAFVFPSLYEGFGLPVLEAMAWGTPVISSNASSLPEVVGSAGLLVDPLDVDELATAMLRVLDEPGLRSRLVEAGLARASQFTWDRCAEVVERAFIEILSD
jgi:glycosyltransferase involved in cell wall biosynthesis